MQPSPGTNYRYCEATSGCDTSRELIDHWRASGRKVLTGQYESKTFGNDGWVHFTEGNKRLPESPPPKYVAGCTYNGYIDSHPTVEEGAVTRVMRFPDTDFTYPIEVPHLVTFVTLASHRARRRRAEHEDRGPCAVTKITFTPYILSIEIKFLAILKLEPKSIGKMRFFSFQRNQDQVFILYIIRNRRYVENCGDRYVYFLSSGIKNDYCYAADVDVCSDQVYYEIHDERRLHYSHKAGTSFTRFDLDNKFNGWIRYTMGLGRMMEEAPAISNMCYAEYQGWINGTHPEANDGVVKRQVCWKHGSDTCKKTNEISIRNCGSFYVYGISSIPPNNQYGHCVEQSKEAVCKGAESLYNPKRGMLTPTTDYIQDQVKIIRIPYIMFAKGKLPLVRPEVEIIGVCRTGQFQIFTTVGPLGGKGFVR
eukprot:sb/3465018/